MGGMGGMAGGGAHEHGGGPAAEAAEHAEEPAGEGGAELGGENGLLGDE
jgi:hypothetical protein